MPIRNVGLNFDGSTVHLTIGRVEIPIISMSYGDNVKAEWVYRTGFQAPEADTPGIYEPEEGSVKISAINARTQLFPRLAGLGAANTRRQAVVTRVHPDIGSDSDALIGFRIMGTKASIEASAKGEEMEFKIRYLMVAWTEQRKMFGNPAGTGAIGIVQL